MRYVIAASTERAVEACRSALAGRPGVEFRVGSVPETGEDCDAAILSFPLAHERYGGLPRLGAAQVLMNGREDGAPRIILATPPAPAQRPGGSGGDSEFERHAFHVLNACMVEFLNEFPDREKGAKVLIHLEAAAIDRVDLGAPLRGVLKFLEQAPPIGSA